MSGDEQELDPANVFFILVRPVYLGNIGSLARLIKNFGFSNLRLVDAPRNYKDAEARKMSVGAFDVLKKAATYEDFHDSIADMNFVIGTTSGQQRSQPLVPLPTAIERAAQISATNKIAVVLGDERNGLSTEELTACHCLARIPTDPAFPALNVAQAGGIIAYELSQRAVPRRSENSPLQLPSVSEDDQLFGQLSLLLDNVEFSRRYNKSNVIGELRQFYRRAMPSKRECDLLRGILHKLNQSIAPSGEHG